MRAVRGLAGCGGMLDWPAFFLPMSVAMLPACQLFGTLGCHLCELAEAQLMPLVAAGLQVEVVDIVERAEWVERYGVRIPVLLRLDTEAELGWPFDTAQAAAFLGLPGAAALTE